MNRWEIEVIDSVGNQFFFICSCAGAHDRIEVGESGTIILKNVKEWWEEEEELKSQKYAIYIFPRESYKNIKVVPYESGVIAAKRKNL